MAIKLLDLNFRRDTIAEDVTSREWPHRVAALVDRIQAINPLIITAQECTNHQAQGVQDGLGLNWTFVGNNVKVFWRTDALRAVEGTLLDITLPSGKRHRWAHLLRLKHLSSGWGAWVGSTHLAANEGDEEEPNPQKIRETQIRTVCEVVDHHIASFPPFPGDGATPNLVMGADINDSSQTGGVRKVAAGYGWRRLQDRVPKADIHGEAMNSFNGWAKTKLDGRWIDDVFTRGIDLEECTVRRMDKDVMPVYGSDHNGLEVLIPTKTF